MPVTIRVLVGFLLCDKLPEGTDLKEERLVWFMVSAISDPGQLTPLLLGLW